MNADASRVALAPILPEKLPVLRNLFELYCHDFSEYLALELQPNGRFEIAIGDERWGEAGHFAYFIQVGDKLCGFILVKQGSVVGGASDVLDVAEFFVVRGVRRTGVGASAAQLLFKTLPGIWEVRVRVNNVPALEFWRHAAQAAAGMPVTPEAFHTQGVEWAVFRLDLWV